MADAKDLASTLQFIASHAETPQIAVSMVASMIDGVAGWTDLTPLLIQDPNGNELTQVDGVSVHLNDMIYKEADHG